MYVCICKGITQKDIQNAVEEGFSLSDMRKKMGLASECGSCCQYAKQLVKQTKAELNSLEELAYAV